MVRIAQAIGAPRTGFSLFLRLIGRRAFVFRGAAPRFPLSRPPSASPSTTMVLLRGFLSEREGAMRTIEVALLQTLLVCMRQLHCLGIGLRPHCRAQVQRLSLRTYQIVLHGRHPVAEVLGVHHQEFLPNLHNKSMLVRVALHDSEDRLNLSPHLAHTLKSRLKGSDRLSHL